MNGNIWNIIRSIIPSIYFNFHYLPLKQAIKLPILLYKPSFIQCKGKIILEGGARFGLIKLGFPAVSVFPNSGIKYENKGGVLVFCGKCNIGNNSFISLGESGNVEFGDKFCATTSFRLVSYNKITFGKNVLFGWECICLDTDFHRLTRIDGVSVKAYGPIIIEDNCWISMKCVILKNTRLASYSIAGANSTLNTVYEESKCLYAGTPAKLVKRGIFRDPDSDSISYQ